jgi:signal transduction histidine kinase
MTTAILSVSLILFSVIDIIGSLPVILDMKKRGVTIHASTTTLTAGILMVAFLFFGGFAFYNFRKRKKIEKLQALADERLRISRDLHDDMGASLSSISVFSSAVKQKLMNNETSAAEHLLDRMSTDAEEMVTSMSEMVWTISPHNDTIEKLTDRLQVYAAGMLSAKNISFSLECDEDLKNKKLPVYMRKNIFLILKEAINNAAKYSDASEVKLRVSKKENHFVAVLSDNGKGFEFSAHKNKNGEAGNGLKNMRQRADEVQAQLEIISEINKGSSVTFMCFIPKIGEL